METAKTHVLCLGIKSEIFELYLIVVSHVQHQTTFREMYNIFISHLKSCSCDKGSTYAYCDFC